MAYTGINKSTAQFDVKLYSGNNNAQTISGIGFAPDFTWLKCRSNGYTHMLFDRVRGATKYISTYTNGAEITSTQSLKSFTNDGFTLGTQDLVANNGNTWVTYNFKANGSGSSNTNGATSSTVSANTTNGFSIVKWSGYNTTVGHGLGVAPDMILVKNLDDAQDFYVYNKELGKNKFTRLNENGGSITNTTIWNNTDPTSTVFSIGSSPFNNANYIAYCFVNTTGFSKFGTYKGSANATNGFIYTGFKPQFMMSVNTQSDSNWMMWDNKRNTFNPRDKWIHANGADQEYTQANSVHFLSNGFSFGVTGHPNEAEQYTYMCFGQSLVGSNNVPATAE